MCTVWPPPHWHSAVSIAAFLLRWLSVRVGVFFFNQVICTCPSVFAFSWRQIRFWLLSPSVCFLLFLPPPGTMSLLSLPCLVLKHVLCPVSAHFALNAFFSCFSSNALSPVVHHVEDAVRLQEIFHCVYLGLDLCEHNMSITEMFNHSFMPTKATFLGFLLKFRVSISSSGWISLCATVCVQAAAGQPERRQTLAAPRRFKAHQSC